MLIEFLTFNAGKWEIKTQMWVDTLLSPSWNPTSHIVVTMLFQKIKFLAQRGRTIQERLFHQCLGCKKCHTVHLPNLIPWHQQEWPTALDEGTRKTCCTQPCRRIVYRDIQVHEENLLCQSKGLFSPVSYHEWKSSRIRNWLKGRSLSFVSPYFKYQNWKTNFPNRDSQTVARKESKKVRFCCYHFYLFFCANPFHYFLHSLHLVSFSYMDSNPTKRN